jgi:hypothetical protein
MSVVGVLRYVNVKIGKNEEWIFIMFQIFAIFVNGRENYFTFKSSGIEMTWHGKTRWKFVNPLAMECNLQAFFPWLGCITNKHIAFWLKYEGPSGFIMLVFLAFWTIH